MAPLDARRHRRVRRTLSLPGQHLEQAAARARARHRRELREVFVRDSGVELQAPTARDVAPSASIASSASKRAGTDRPAVCGR